MKSVTIPRALLILLAELAACLRAEAAGGANPAGAELIADIDAALAELRPILGDRRIDDLLAYGDVIDQNRASAGQPAGRTLSA